MKALLERFEKVEWVYDGLNGKIIPWTSEHGNKSHDPSVQAFVLKPDGEVLSRAPNAQVYQPGSFVKWAKAQVDDYEKRFPLTRVPFVRSDVTEQGDGVRCAALDEAREAKKPVLLYFGRGERSGQAKKLRGEVKAARKFEKGTLGSKKAAEAAAGFVLIRFDLGEPHHATLANTFGVEKAPALVLIEPGAEAPELLKAKISGASLAYRLKKVGEGD